MLNREAISPILSTAFSPMCRNDTLRHARCIMLKDILDRIEQRLKAVKLTASAASKLAGKPDAIRNIRRYVRDGDAQGVTLNTLAAIAVPLQTTATWLMCGEDEVNATIAPQSGVRLVPVTRTIQAGAWVYLRILDEPKEWLPYAGDEYQSLELFAARIVANDTHKGYEGGSYVICAPAVEVGVHEGDHVVLTLGDASGKCETTLRVAALKNGRLELLSLSTDEAHQDPFIPPLPGETSSISWRITGVVIAAYSKRTPRGGRIIDIG